jgi:iron complex outermembrane recepter protein
VLKKRGTSVPATTVAVGLAMIVGSLVAVKSAWAQDASPESSEAIALPTLAVDGNRSDGGENGGGEAKGFAAKKAQSATKTATDLIETPQAVTVITEDRMRTTNAESVADALRYTAGVTDYGGRDDPRGYGGSIRGFSADTYLDGLRLPDASSSQSFDLEPYGLDRLEVLRGASSALYGGGSLGGIVNGESKTPRPDQVNELSLQSGSFNRLQGAADLGGAATEDGSLLWRLVTLLRKSDTQFKDIKNDRIYVAPSLKWIGDASTLTLLANFMQIEAGSSGQFLPAAGTVLYNPNGAIDRDILMGDPTFDVYSKRQISAGYKFEHEVNPNLTLRQNLRYAHLDLTYRFVTAVSLLADERTLTRKALLQSSTYNTVALDNQAEYRTATGPLTHDLLTGVDFSSQFIALRRGEGKAPSLDLYDPVYLPVTSPTYANKTNTNQTELQTGLYAQDQIGWNNWRLTLTGREDFTRSRIDDHNAGTETTSTPQAFTYRTALLYAFPVGVSPYVSYATSFQPQTGTDAQGSPFSPLTGDQVEAGIKYKPSWTQALFSVAAYSLTQQNVLTPDPNNSSYDVETGEIRTRGLEFEAQGSLAHRINVIATLTFQDPRVTKSNTAAEIGNRPVAVPSQMASLYLDKTWTLEEQLAFGLGGGVRYNGDTEGSDPNTFTVPSQTVLDLNAHADYRNWRFQVNVTNLTDERLYAACTRAVSCSFATGRAVYGTLSYRW